MGTGVRARACRQRCEPQALYLPGVGFAALALAATRAVGSGDESKC